MQVKTKKVTATSQLPKKGLKSAIKNLANYPAKYKKQGVTKIDFNNIDAIGRIYCEAFFIQQLFKKYLQQNS